MNHSARMELDNRRLLVRLSVAAVVMFCFGFLLVPFYDKICDATGLNNLVRPDRDAVLKIVSRANSQVDTSRTIVVQFDANAHDLPWRFEPLTRSLRVHPGELAQVAYEVSNNRAEAVTGQAVPSYGPMAAGQYFLKMECFCFSQQTLKAGEKRTMPVVFVIDPNLPADVSTITLSYTFFEVAGRRLTAGLSSPPLVMQSGTAQPVMQPV